MFNGTMVQNCLDHQILKHCRRDAQCRKVLLLPGTRASRPHQKLLIWATAVVIMKPLRPGRPPSRPKLCSIMREAGIPGIKNQCFAGTMRLPLRATLSSYFPLLDRSPSFTFCWGTFP
jgi:hypothetical protein